MTPRREASWTGTIHPHLQRLGEEQAASTVTAVMDGLQAMTQQPQERLTPALALELRLRKLESLVGSPAASAGSTGRPASIRALAAKRAIEDATSSNGPGSNVSTSQSSLASLRRFVHQDFDVSRRYLSAGFRGHATAGKDADPSAQDYRQQGPLTPEEQMLILLDSQADMRTLERILGECRELDSRGAASAGKLAGCEEHSARLKALDEKLKSHLMPQLTQQEQGLFDLLADYQRHTNAMSQLFMHWDAALDEMNDQVTRLEKHKSELAQG
ncbi:unnamed protein product [Parajaminaea phylloscopi]